MTVGDIIKNVRWCIDEERLNSADLAGASQYDITGEHTTDIGLMDNIIKHKIVDALRWVSLYAPAELLCGSSTTTTTTLGEGEEEPPVPIDLIEEETSATVTNNLIALPENFLRLLRVRGANWHRAIMESSLLREDSDEYLQLHDTNGAEATVDRPQAAIIQTKVKKLEVWPSTGAGTFTVTYVVTPSVSDLSSLDDSGAEDIEVNVPTLLETSFIYYLAYLLLTAYGDGRAKSMLDVATLNMKR